MPSRSRKLGRASPSAAQLLVQVTLLRPGAGVLRDPVPCAPRVLPPPPGSPQSLAAPGRPPDRSPGPPRAAWTPQSSSRTPMVGTARAASPGAAPRTSWTSPSSSTMIMTICSKVGGAVNPSSTPICPPPPAVLGRVWGGDTGSHLAPDATFPGEGMVCVCVGASSR